MNTNLFIGLTISCLACVVGCGAGGDATAGAADEVNAAGGRGRPGAEPDSVYTSLTKCKVSVDEETASSVSECDGVGGYGLVIEDGDSRTNVIVTTPKGKKEALDLGSVGGGGFSRVGEKAEWRVTERDKVHALIFRYFVTEQPKGDGVEGREHPYLVVAKVTAEGACVFDLVDTLAANLGPANERAREAADFAKEGGLDRCD